MLPYNAHTFAQSYSGNSTSTILSPPCTILGFQVQQENVASNFYLYDGNDLIYVNHAKDTPFVETNYKCQNDIRVIKEGQDTAHLILNYTDYDRTTGSTTDTMAYNGFSFGEIVLCFFVFIIMIAKVFSFITGRFIKKKGFS